MLKKFYCSVTLFIFIFLLFAAKVGAATISLADGWSLICPRFAITASETFSDSSKFTSIWKWDNNNWAVYLPGEETPGTYATSKGFTILSGINPGEGFWVNSKGAQSIAVNGTEVSNDSISVVSGWNLRGLISTSSINVSSLFSDVQKFVSVWKWENGTWAVYLPGEATPGEYATAKEFAPLSTLNSGEGFWVNSSAALTQIIFDAVIGEAVKLGDLIFPKLVEENNTAIDEKWNEIDAIYEQLALITIPGDYEVEDVCDHLDDIPGASLIANLNTLCEQLDTGIDEISNLQEAVNYAADYLWESNNEEVALVNGNGLSLATSEGVATIKVTDPNGNHTHNIVINAQKIVQKVHQLDMQNEAFVSIEDNSIKSFNADGSVKVEASVSIESYAAESGQVVLSGEGAYLVAQEQSIAFPPSAFFPDGALRKVNTVTDNGDGTFTLLTEEGSLSDIVNNLDMEHKEAVDPEGAEQTDTDTDLEAQGMSKLAKGVRRISAEEFRNAIVKSERGKAMMKYMKTGQDDANIKNDLILLASISKKWEPDFAFEFDKTDSQSNESDGSGSMGIKGVIGFKMPIKLYLRTKDYKLQKFITSFKPTQYSEITIEVDGDADIERTLVEVLGPKLKFFIGPLPVYVRPVFEISVGGAAKGKNVVLKVVDYEVWCEYGVSYERDRPGKDWRPIAHYERNFADPAIEDGDFQLSAWGQVETYLKFYGVGGPYARAQIGAKLTGDTSKTEEDQDWAWLDSYVKVWTGVKMDITIDLWLFDVEVVDIDKNFGKILDLKRQEWDSNGPYGS